MPDGWEPVVPFDRCFDAQYGLDVLSAELDEEGVARARVRVREELLNHLGVVHGGVFASVAEALTSRATALDVMPRGRVAVGLSNDTTVLESPSEGTITVDATVRGRGDEEWVWTVDARDARGRLCAYSLVSVAVRDAQPT